MVGFEAYDNRSSRPEVFFKWGVLRNFVKFTGEHLCQSFLNKTSLINKFDTEKCYWKKHIFCFDLWKKTRWLFSSSQFNDTLREKLCFTQFSQEWLLGCFWTFSFVYTISQGLYIPLSLIKSTDVWKLRLIKQ